METKPETQNAKPETSNSSNLSDLSNVQTSFVSPRAKNLASKEALNANELAGSGPNGRVIEKDVLAALENRPKLTPLAKKIAAEEGVQPQGAGSGLAGTAKAADLLPPPVNTVYGVDYEDKKLSNMRKIIAKSMHASLQNSAQLTHHLGADARNIQNLRKKAKKAFEAGTLSANLTINDFVCFAVVKALKKFPNANSHFLGESMRLFNKVHLGLAVDTERGLMVPAVRNADDLSIIGLSNQLKEVANACKKGAISKPASIAFATANSESALPSAMESMEAFGVPRKIVSFVIPTGYSFNLDGSTLYLSLAAIFVAQAAGIDMPIGQQFAIALTLMLTSKGVAGVSRASFVILLGTVTTFGLPVEPVMIILGIDVLLDMGRTGVNVIGNCLATAVIARWEGEFDDAKAKG